MKRYKKTVQISKFSEKYTEYYMKCMTNRVNCLEGAYRAGKSVINVYSFANHIDHCQDKIHLVSGVSSSKARLNVSDCSGIGLSNIFRGRCKPSKYEGNECLRIEARVGGEKIVLFAGGGKADSYRAVTGLTFGSWLAVELDKYYISDDGKDFIDMALSRLTSSKDQKIWWDLNPTYPTHKLYTKYLDRYLEDQENGKFVGGYNYMRCTLFDNTSLTEDQVAEALYRYPDENSMEYKRYILGVRACAEGLIFSLFARDNTPWVVTDLSEFLKGVRPQFISIGVDFGGNGSNTTFVASVLYNNFRGVLVIADDLLDMKGGEQDVKSFRDRLRQFLLFVVNFNKAIPVRAIYGDSAETVMVNEIKSVVKDLRLLSTVRVMGCEKATIKERIDAKKLMMAEGRYFISDKATHVINSTSTQVWDTRQGHEDERLDNGSVDIDTADAEEYSWSAQIPKLIAVR